MPPKKLENTTQATHPVAALADCEDLMLCILARLPVKSIIRFKPVCKHWNHLFSTQEFVRMQFKLSSESKNQSFLVHTLDKNGSNNISVFNIESNEKKASFLDQPFNDTSVGISFVGCCNGLVCIRCDQGIVLWNPAMNLSKTLSPLKDHESVSLGFGFDAEGDDFQMILGFGYDAEGDDFKVVRIVFLEENIRLSMGASWVEVYSLNSNSWTTIDPGFQFSEMWFDLIYNSVTVNGNPYWVGNVDEEIKHVLICFDMSKLVFKIVPLTSLDYNKAEQAIEFVDLNGSLGALVVSWENEESDEYVDSWVFDVGEQIWTKSHSVGPIQVKTDYVLRSLKDGRILCTRPNGQLIVFNSETKCVKGLFNVGHDFWVYDYTESLAYIQGMEKVKLKKRRDHWNKSKVLGVCLFSVMLIVSNLKYFRSSRTRNKH